MSDDLSPVLSLPLIQPAQAQKHVTHNEALRLLDVLVQPAVASRSIATPPGFPAQGGRWIVASGATGAWAGHEGAIALHDQGAWVFLAPQPGWQVQVIDEGAPVHWTGTAWLAQADLPQRFPRIGVATDADAANRLAVASPATLFTHVGAGHQLKLNKAAAADTASLLFQTGWSGRAEMGTAGSDDFAIKVSPDGTTWTTALSIAAATGTVTGAAIAQLPADTTAGRLFAFGNYVNQTGTGGPWGLGASHAVNVPDNDANAIARAGFYRVGSSSTVVNVPDSAFGGVIVHHPYSATYAAQTYIMTNGANAGLFWVRHCTNGTWAAWRRVYTQGSAVGALGQSGGVPTGALIERGSNANGSYTRWADGTQICWNAAGITTNPAAFSDTPVSIDSNKLRIGRWF